MPEPSGAPAPVAHTVPAGALAPKVRPLVDSFGRQVLDLRISVTDRCNFRCTYCMPSEDMQWLPRSDILSFEEIERVARVFVTYFGVTSLRITGGEPTVRAELPKLVGKLARLPVELSMTTNGASLRRLAQPLRAAGLHRVTISLDSLRPERFAAITGRDSLPQVLAGVEAAKAAGLEPVKVNAVLVRGVNDDEVLDLARYGRGHGVEMRFIEFMPLDGDGGWATERVVPASEVIERIDAEFPVEPMPQRGNQPAERWRYQDGEGYVGVVASVTRSFCHLCDRVRLTAEGELRSCLFSVTERDLRALLRSGAGDDELAEAIEAEVALKWAGHRIGQVNFIRPARSMSQIGG
ncbi:MAG TPA: GTP 3',8-cyclase MoaA [Acidimicrobiales bacterium]|nr:GTP 3',8-cyclase MoaA [Acidimicrobiales bacterium]